MGIIRKEDRAKQTETYTTALRERTIRVDTAMDSLVGMLPSIVQDLTEAAQSSYSRQEVPNPMVTNVQVKAPEKFHVLRGHIPATEMIREAFAKDEPRAVKVEFVISEGSEGDEYLYVKAHFKPPLD